MFINCGPVMPPSPANLTVLKSGILMSASLALAQNVSPIVNRRVSTRNLLVIVFMALRRICESHRRKPNYFLRSFNSLPTSTNSPFVCGFSSLLLGQKCERHSAQHTRKRRVMIPSDFFAEINHGETAEHCQRDDFLDDLELRG